MQTLTENGITYYLDDLAISLGQKYDRSKIKVPFGPTNDCGTNVALYLFLQVARDSDNFWGLNYDGFNQVLDSYDGSEYFSEANVRWAHYAVKAENDLDKLAQRGFLRESMCESEAVYFASEILIAKSTEAFPSTERKQSSVVRFFDWLYSLFR